MLLPVTSSPRWEHRSDPQVIQVLRLQLQAPSRRAWLGQRAGACSQTASPPRSGPSLRALDSGPTDLLLQRQACPLTTLGKWAWVREIQQSCLASKQNLIPLLRTSLLIASVLQGRFRGAGSSEPPCGGQCTVPPASIPTTEQLRDWGKLIPSSCGGKRPTTANTTLVEKNTVGGGHHSTSRFSVKPQQSTQCGVGAVTNRPMDQK